MANLAYHEEDNPGAKVATVDQLERAARLILDCCPHDGPRDERMRDRLLDFRDRLIRMQLDEYGDGRAATVERLVSLVEWSLS